MSVVEWDGSLETGDPTIDSQHKELFALINELHDSTVEGWAEEGVRDVMARLTAYVTVHFDAERSLMERMEYPADMMAEHLEAHGDLKSRAGALIEAYSGGETVTSLQLVDFLYEWLRTHIRQIDMTMIAFARERGANA